MTQPIPVDEAYALAGLQKLEVDIRSLADFADALRQEVDINLKPAWTRISAVLDEPRFGRSDELGLGYKRSLYDTYIQDAKLFFQNVITGTVQLAEAADRIGAAYGRTDADAGIQVTDVTAVLPATTSPYRPPPSDQRGI